MSQSVNRRVFITGSTGYVGTVLAPALALDYPVVSYDLQAFGNALAGAPGIVSVQGDVRDTDRIRAVLKSEAITDVIWLAGIVTDELTDLNVARAREINVDALRDALVVCRKQGVRRFVLMSSSSVYGTTEEPATEDTPVNPMTAYAQSKFDQEVQLKFGSGFMVSTIIRSATLMGPAPRMRLDTITGAFSKQAWFDGRITVHGGDQWRSNVHVQDVAECYRRILAAEASAVDGRVYNLVQSYQTAKAIAEKVRRGVAVIKGVHHNAIELHIDRSKVDLRHYKMVSTRVRADLGWSPSKTIEQAAMANAEWFVAGNVKDPESDLYINNRRMAASMREA